MHSISPCTTWSRGASWSRKRMVCGPPHNFGWPAGTGNKNQNLEGNTWLMRRCQAPIRTFTSCWSVFRPRPCIQWTEMKRRGERLPESQKEAHATLSVVIPLVLLCWPRQCRKGEGHFQVGLLFSGSGAVLRLTSVGENPNILGTILQTPLLAGYSGWQNHALLPPLPQLFPHPVGMFWTWATACGLNKCGLCVHKPVCILVPNLTVYM